MDVKLAINHEARYTQGHSVSCSALRSLTELWGWDVNYHPVINRNTLSWLS